MNGHFDPSHMLSFDLETTGVDPQTAKIVTSALVNIRGKERDDLEMLADPGIEIPEQASAVHGITTEYAREHGKPHDEVLAETIRRIRQGWDDGATLIVYNATYDLSVLRALEPSFTVDGPVFDPFVVDKEKNKFRKGKRTLENVCAHYNVPLDNAHEATADAVAAARVAWKLTREFPELVEMTSDELTLAQSTWYYQSQVELQAWFEKQGKNTSVNNNWPIAS
ncbi:3'-5' exonuclease [uncultured Corynebacterium sp.]|uniref:3'-5' exonuclease n=1 Tax=uncultured Corynebacterium sp. TaxID=159447 RepID=UPI0025985DDA|nr:3'-5' exonuclease [uncultured Corynebacterium sp.]